MRVLLAPRWWGRHLLAISALAVLAFLGRWQWDKAMSNIGRLQNLLYGIEWWFFAAVFCYGWVRLMRDDLAAARAAKDGGPQSTSEGARHAAPSLKLPASLATPSSRPPVASPADEPEDAELAAYNRYLAQLNASAANRRGTRPTPEVAEK